MAISRYNGFFALQATAPLPHRGFCMILDDYPHLAPNLIKDAFYNISHDKPFQYRTYQDIDNRRLYLWQSEKSFNPRSKAYMRDFLARTPWLIIDEGVMVFCRCQTWELADQPCPACGTDRPTPIEYEGTRNKRSKAKPFGFKFGIMEDNDAFFASEDERRALRKEAAKHGMKIWEYLRMLEAQSNT